MFRSAPSFLFLVFASILFGQATGLERFDTSGMPARPTNFAEQKLLDLIASHPEGDLAGAARVHRALARYYADKGDAGRAQLCEERAQAAERAIQGGPHPQGPSEASRPAVVSQPQYQGRQVAPAAPVPPSPKTGSGCTFSGRFYHMRSGALETWDFNPDGTFYHAWMSSGAGTSVRNSEKGAFRVSDGQLELTVMSSAGGYVTPTAGGRGAAIGGGSDSNAETRRLKIEILGPGKRIILDGVEYKVKSW